MIIQDYIDSFSPKLKEILTQEIKFGNSIKETAMGWPQNNSIIVFLKNPFIKLYNIEDIEYRYIGDPHYWKEQYFDSKKYHTLACNF